MSENQATKLRVVPIEELARGLFRYIFDLKLSSNQNIWGFQQSCISCNNFQQSKEICMLANARPPAKIIAFGCERYSDIDDIPF
jgi:hypothetical protein